jgi:predicted DCC family thiol-disulfide oxidoreductase YuxK
MQSLTVLYDARCNLCAQVKTWLGAQPSYLELIFLPAGSAEARRRFPQLDHTITLSEMTVVSDTGAVYTEANAWVICLWALRNYRAWALRLATPELLPLARRMAIWVSQNRFRFGSRSFDDLLATEVSGPAGALLDARCGTACEIG